jgi:ferric-chelate reductase [NAD(P)H]
MIEQAGTGAHGEVDRSKIDLAAFNAITYGLYVVTARDGERRNGCIINTAVQVAGEPCQISVSVSKANLTHEFITKAAVFAVSVLEQETPLQFIGTFGFRTGRDYDKFAHAAYRDGLTGCPILTEHTLAAIEGKVRTAVDCGSHTVFVADVVASQVVRQGKPLTYDYYHETKGGKTGKNAPTYAASQAAKNQVSERS